ncbi:hypothetical protein AURDEDRAFT_178593 [Auricularia subglabra TFB-10046 SS5]|uniref:Uncharacterized protein n=1 Tax=Auricularia subglabra (strain TFB-10046 / SS5) TaxID=717982 RepID=J0L7N7_AURST|nr:hypothetical protein AURDEDRAFT_178593 [Auricularia subglabra TFB-10046 SS5]
MLVSSVVLSLHYERRERLEVVIPLKTPLTLLNFPLALPLTIITPNISGRPADPEHPQEHCYPGHGGDATSSIRQRLGG